MSDEVSDLERQWRHASQVAFASIGQPDRAENVAWRDELAAKLRIAKMESDPWCTWDRGEVCRATACRLRCRCVHLEIR